MSRPRVALLAHLVVISLLGVGCGSSAGLRASPSRRTTSTPSANLSAQASQDAKLCRWTIANSTDQEHTTPGSFTSKPPGSCPQDELSAVVRLAEALRAGRADGRGVCDLLTQQPLDNARRVAGIDQTSCGRAALQPADDGKISSARMLAQLTGILLESSSPGAPHWSGVLGFATPGLSSHRIDPRYGSINVAITKLPSGRWAIDQIGYVF